MMDLSQKWMVTFAIGITEKKDLGAILQRHVLTGCLPALDTNYSLKPKRF